MRSGIENRIVAGASVGVGEWDVLSQCHERSVSIYVVALFLAALCRRLRDQSPVEVMLQTQGCQNQ
jgi:hypothetical protein